MAKASVLLGRVQMTIASSPEPLALTWGTLGATEVVPATMPRLGARQAAVVLARVKHATPGNARVQGDVFGFTAVTPPRAPEGATTPLGPLARRWARERLDELVAAGNSRAVAAHALRYGLVSPQPSMVAIASDVVVEGGVKHTTSVPVSVPAGMRWQLVEQATHVDTKHEHEADEDDDAKMDKRASKKRAAKDVDEGGDEDASEAPAPTTMDRPALAPPTETGSAAEEVMVMGLSPYHRRRLSLALGTGLSVVNGRADAAGALVARFETGAGRTLVGVEGSLWLVGGLHAEGSLLGTATRGIARRLELGVGGGLHLTGTGVGPALDLALRVPLAHELRLYLRYDGALILHDGTFDGQNAGTAGIETSW